ncbi:MAG TPA: polysaccharide deacetylase family protein, partial [Abditibacteriaceae bacterium]
LNSGSLGRDVGTNSDQSGHLYAAEVEELYRGHEVAIHTVSHPHLPKLDTAQIAREVLEDRCALEDLVGYPVRGMAYPFGSYDARVIETLRALGVVYSRTCENQARPFPPAEPLAWASTMHQYGGEAGDTVPERFQKMLDNPHASNVFFVWGHGFEFANNDDWDGLERLFKPLAGHDEAWYCTNIELFDYEAARNRVVVAANRGSVYNPNGIAVTVSVDGKLLDVPPGATIALKAG